MRRTMGKIFAEDIDDIRDVRVMIRHDDEEMGDEDTVMRTKTTFEMLVHTGGSERHWD